jgi:hypothetical protein
VQLFAHARTARPRPAGPNSSLFGVVLYEPRVTLLVEIQFVHFGEGEWSRAAAAEDCDLAPGFVDRAVALERA